MKTTNLYQWPIDKSAVSHTVYQSSSHSGWYEHAIDLAVPAGTAVFCAADGVVKRTKDDTALYGDNPKFSKTVNYVTIEHDNNELSEYLHLAKGSVIVKVGDPVQAGQKIAETGLSGWMTEPHLHWMVYPKGKNFDNSQTLEIRIAD